MVETAHEKDPSAAPVSSATPVSIVKSGSLVPALGSAKGRKRIGRGIGSGTGKTAGRGHKGQRSRSGRSVHLGFEGGQMPIQMRLPKFGFTSRKARTTANLRLDVLGKVQGDEVTMASLSQASVINRRMLRVKVFMAGQLTRPVIITDECIRLSAGAKRALEQAGGKIDYVKPSKADTTTSSEVTDGLAPPQN